MGWVGTGGGGSGGGGDGDDGGKVDRAGLSGDERLLHEVEDRHECTVTCCCCGEKTTGDKTGVAKWRGVGEDKDGGTGDRGGMSNEDVQWGREEEDRRAWGEVAYGNSDSTKRTWREMNRRWVVGSRHL